MNDNTNNSTSPRPQGQGEERRRRPIDEMLARDVEELISRDGDGEYEWRDTKSALVEACHLAWLTGRITDATGRKLGFGRIVALACRRLGLGAPRNPSAVVRQARMRKDVRLGSLRARYELLMGQGVPDPFRLNVRLRRR